MDDRGDRPDMVVTATPLRLSFAGGGTDLPDYYRTGYGAVLSTAIDKYIYVTVKRHSPLFNERYRLNYSKTEHVDDLDEMENHIARECLRLVDVEPPLYINAIADLPASSGLGSSSSFAVGLLHALHLLRGDTVDAARLAEEAAHIEINRLGRPVGKQDHYAAAVGGMNHIRFMADETVSVERLQMSSADLAELFDSAMLFWTGIRRDAGAVLSEQRGNIADRMRELDFMRDMAVRCRDMLRAGYDPAAFGALLDEGWRIKRDLAAAISSSRIDRWYELALTAGACGGKIAGAGGGGFLFLAVPPERQAAVRAALSDLTEVRVGPSHVGSRLLTSSAGGRTA